MHASLVTFPGPNAFNDHSQDIKKKKCPTNSDDIVLQPVSFAQRTASSVSATTWKMSTNPIFLLIKRTLSVVNNDTTYSNWHVVFFSFHNVQGVHRGKGCGPQVGLFVAINFYHKEVCHLIVFKFFICTNQLAFW